jgi:phenylpropionate dioxygenase-like ring-hydroxylating dioxygenase large terminal subunit
VRLLGEDLVLFRDESGQPGLLGIHCTHRGADLSYGRLEDGGLRCIYHGWLYDRTGRCLEQPGEPAGSTFHQRNHQPAYPCVERNGAIFTYLGPGDPPLFPRYEFLTVPDDHVLAIKLFSECNYLQGIEGGVDLLHLSFLHHNKAHDVIGSGVSGAAVHGRGAAPHAETVDVEMTDYGMKVCKVRQMGETKHLYLGTYVIPGAFAFSGTERDGYAFNWHVPIDDIHHWRYTFIFSRSHALDRSLVQQGRARMTPDYRHLRHSGNRYLQDRTTMHESYTGMGIVFEVQDLCATEGAGPIQDHSQEHLTPNDRPVAMTRWILLKGIKDIQEGRDPPHVMRDPAENRFPQVFAASEFVPSETDWRTFFGGLDAEPDRERAAAATR